MAIRSRRESRSRERFSSSFSSFSRSPSPSFSSPSSKANRRVMWLLGLGFWVQGFRCFPWFGVTFFLKDELQVSPSALQILQNSANLPMVGKPVYGVLSDAVRINGEHRLPYIAIGALLQAISWLSIVFLPASYVSVTTLTVFLLLGNFGASIAEVVNDAIVAEAAKHWQSSGHLQSFVWAFTSSAGVLGNLLGGVAVSRFSPTAMFLLFAILLIAQLFTTVSVSESSLNLPQRRNAISNSSSIRRQILDLYSALRITEIAYSIAWLAASFAMVPILLGTMFYYQTEHLKLDSSVIGLSKVFGQVYVLAWSIAYNKWLREVSPRTLLSALQGAIAVLMLSDVLFVNGVYRGLGVPDIVYVIIFSGLLEAVFQFKLLPFSIYIAQLCPVGCEGSLMAFVMSATASASIVSGYLGVALANSFGVTEKDFSGFTMAIVVQAICSAVPVCFSSWISGDRRSKEFKQFKIK